MLRGVDREKRILLLVNLVSLFESVRVLEAMAPSTLDGNPQELCRMTDTEGGKLINS